MPDWNPDELNAFGDANEIQLTTTRAHGSLRSYIPIWVVRIGDALYVRSYRGASGSWYRHARRHPFGHIRITGVERDVQFADPGAITSTTIDDAYRRKYGSGGYVDTMVRADVAATTLMLTPL